MTRPRLHPGWLEPLLLFCLALSILISPEQAYTEQSLQDASSPVSLDVELDRYQATLGDLVTYTVSVWHEAAIEPGTPEFATIEGLEIVERGKHTPESNKEQEQTQFWVQYRVDRIGKILFPKIDVPFTVRKNAKETSGTAATWEVELEVQSLLHLQGETKDIRDIKPVLPAGKDWLPILFTLLVCVGLLGFACFIWRRAKRRQTNASQVTTVLLSPQDRAFKELKVLREKRLLEAARVREYHFGLSEIFRRYLKDRYAFPALDWTTEEIVGFMHRAAFLESSLQESVDAVLRETDRVKFARFSGGLPNDAMADIVRLIKTTAEKTDSLSSRQPAEKP